MQLDLNAALVESLPELSLEALAQTTGRQHLKERQDFLVNLASRAYQNRRPHAHEVGAVSFTRDELVAGLRASKNSYATAMRLLFTFPQGRTGYSPRHRTTKAYTLKPHVRHAMETLMRGDLSIPVRSDSLPGQASLPPSPPPNGVPDVLADRISVPSIFPLSVEDVDRALEAVERWASQAGTDVAPLDAERPDGWTLADARRNLYVCRQWARSIGGIPNSLALLSNGRLGPADSTAPHIINLPSRLRSVLLESTRLVDYDVKACHWSIYLALAESRPGSRPLQCSAAADYLRNRNAWHQHLHELTGAPTGIIKRSLLTLLNGGTISPSPLTATGKMLGREGALALQQSQFVRALARETRQGIKVLCHAWAEGSPVLVNAVGCPLVKDKPATIGQQASHLFTGVEQLAMRAMCQRAKGLGSIIFDGFIADAQDTKPLVKAADDAAVQALGFPLHLELKARPFAP